MFLRVSFAAVSHIPTYQHRVISAATPVCKSWRLTRRLAWHPFTQNHAMPPWSTNRSTMQLLTERMLLSLKPGTHKQMPVPTQSLMRPLVLSLGTRDEKRGMTERKNWMLPPLAASQGFDIASPCYRRAEIDMGRGWEKKTGEGERRVSSTDMPAVCLSIFLLHQLCSHSPSNRRTVFHWSETSHNREEDHFTFSYMQIPQKHTGPLLVDLTD